MKIKKPYIIVSETSAGECEAEVCRLVTKEGYRAVGGVFAIDHGGELRVMQAVELRNDSEFAAVDATLYPMPERG